MSERPNEASETAESEVLRLQAALRSERDKVTSLQAEIQQLKVSQVEILATAEAQEEYITNMLLKKLEAITTERDALVARVSVIQKEREALIVQLEQEEEYLTNTLQKKLSTVLREKIELENQLEQEEEYIVNELQKKLNKLQAEKAALEVRLQEERESHETLRRTQGQLAKAQQQNADLQRELLTIKSENFGLTQRISKEQQQLQSIATEKAKLEQGIELEDERVFNMERRLNSGGPTSSRPGGRHRTRSQSLPVQDGDLPSPRLGHSARSGGTGIPITAVSVPLTTSSGGSTPTRLSRSNSGSGGIPTVNTSGSKDNASSDSGTSSPATAITSPPSSPRSSDPLLHAQQQGTVCGGANSSSSSPIGSGSPTNLSPSSSTSAIQGDRPGSGGGRSRRLSFAQNASLMAAYPSTPRANSTAAVLKSGWMRSTHKSKLVDPQADEYEVDPEPATDLFFVLSDDSTLVAWMSELKGEDGTGSLFGINLDTVVKRTQDADNGEFVLETKDSFYHLRPQGEDTTGWCDLLQQLDPLASTPTSTPQSTPAQSH